MACGMYVVCPFAGRDCMLLYRRVKCLWHHQPVHAMLEVSWLLSQSAYDAACPEGPKGL